MPGFVTIFPFLARSWERHIWDDLVCGSIVVLSARLLPRRAKVTARK